MSTMQLVTPIKEHVCSMYKNTIHPIFSLFINIALFSPLIVNDNHILLHKVENMYVLPFILEIGF